MLVNTVDMNHLKVIWDFKGSTDNDAAFVRSQVLILYNTRTTYLHDILPLEFCCLQLLHLFDLL